MATQKTTVLIIRTTFVLFATGTIIVELDRALCGCLQSARRWYDTHKEVLTAMKYECSVTQDRL